MHSLALGLQNATLRSAELNQEAKLKTRGRQLVDSQQLQAHVPPHASYLQGLAL